MPMTCSVCRLPADRLRAVHRDLGRRVPYRTIAIRYEVGKSALVRHVKAGHVARAVAVQPGETGRVGGPPRRYSWPPFEPGNVASVTHGATSVRLVDPLAQRMAADLLAQAAEPGSRVAYLAEPSYASAVAAWARTEARIALVSDYLHKHDGDLDKDGEARGAARLLNELEGTASRARARLGLDPLSRARLGKDIAGQALDLARLWAAEAGQEGGNGHAPATGSLRVLQEGQG